MIKLRSDNFLYVLLIKPPMNSFKPKRSISIGAESFFFEEGSAAKFEKAKYGALRVDSEGNSILVGLYNENRKAIK